MEYSTVEYNAVSTSNSIFKQPRQKMWGVFVAVSKTGNINKWKLIYLNNDFDGAKEIFNDWLQNPKDPSLAGMDNIIMTEVLPANSSTRN
ncbi:hypothetical protein Goe21_00740 [Bacillus phage vB_BsuM-Goe21]|nr:hypothetical protein Goe21_00740 [Bacillus phage vB_BsuM-Goe21]